MDLLPALIILGVCFLAQTGAMVFASWKFTEYMRDRDAAEAAERSRLADRIQHPQMIQPHEVVAPETVIPSDHDVDMEFANTPEARIDWDLDLMPEEAL